MTTIISDSVFLRAQAARCAARDPEAATRLCGVAETLERQGEALLEGRRDTSRLDLLEVGLVRAERYVDLAPGFRPVDLYRVTIGEYTAEAPDLRQAIEDAWEGAQVGSLQGVDDGDLH